MNIQTTFNEDIATKLKLLVAKELKEIIFFSDSPTRFSARFPSRDKIPYFAGTRLALVFKMPSLLNKEERILGVLSLKCSYFNTDSYIIDSRFGGRSWNIDFHFDTIVGDKKMGVFVKKVEEVELYEEYSKSHRKVTNAFTSFSDIKQSVSKIEVFGMKEYFEDVSKVDFENMSYLNQEAFEKFSYPIDINIITFIVVTLSEDTYLLIKVKDRKTVQVFFCGSKEFEKMYESMKSKKNIFNRPFAKLLYTTETV